MGEAARGTGTRREKGPGRGVVGRGPGLCVFRRCLAEGYLTSRAK